MHEKNIRQVKIIFYLVPNTVKTIFSPGFRVIPWWKVKIFRYITTSLVFLDIKHGAYASTFNKNETRVNYDVFMCLLKKHGMLKDKFIFLSKIHFNKSPVPSSARDLYIENPPNNSSSYELRNLKIVWIWMISTIVTKCRGLVRMDNQPYKSGIFLIWKFYISQWRSVPWRKVHNYNNVIAPAVS